MTHEGITQMERRRRKTVAGNKQVAYTRGLITVKPEFLSRLRCTTAMWSVDLPGVRLLSRVILSTRALAGLSVLLMIWDKRRG